MRASMSTASVKDLVRMMEYDKVPGFVDVCEITWEMMKHMSVHLLCFVVFICPWRMKREMFSFTDVTLNFV